MQRWQKACPLTLAIFPTGSDFTLHATHQVRKQDMTQAVQMYTDRRPILSASISITWHYNACILLCCNTIEMVPSPIRIGSQNLGTACDQGQYFCHCCTNATGNWRNNSTQLICTQVKELSLYTGYMN